MAFREWNSDWQTAIRRACELCGGVKALERAAGLPRNSIVFSLTTRRKAPPFEIAVAVSRATNGVVKVSDILPDTVSAYTEARKLETRRRGGRPKAA